MEADTEVVVAASLRRHGDLPLRRFVPDDVAAVMAKTYSAPTFENVVVQVACSMNSNSGSPKAPLGTSTEPSWRGTAEHKSPAPLLKSTVPWANMVEMVAVKVTC